MKLLVDNLVTLGTPIRPDYVPNNNVIGQHINVYSKLDSIQINGGFDKYIGDDPSGILMGSGESGKAGRIVSGAVNIDVTEYTKDSVVGTVAHSQLWGVQSIWDKAVVPKLKK